jgi:hypothetical protein
MTVSSGGTGNSNIHMMDLRGRSKGVPTPPMFSDAFEYRAFLKFRLAQAYRIFGEHILPRNAKHRYHATQQSMALTKVLLVILLCR